MTIKNRQAGYVAIMLAIIICFVLALLSSAISFSSLNSRLNVLQTENKNRSEALAQACGDEALMRLARDLNYSPSPGGDVVVVGSDLCRILSVSSSGGQITIQTQGLYPELPPNQAQTDIEVVCSSPNLSLISWQDF